MSSNTHAPATAGYSADFVSNILADATGHGCRTYAIAGLQGTGKSTLSAQMAALAARDGRQVVALSIDDFYLGHDARQVLGRRIHPLRSQHRLSHSRARLPS